MKIQELIHFLKPISVEIRVEQDISQVRSIDDPLFDATCLGWCSDKNGHLLEQIQSGNILISKSLNETHCQSGTTVKFNKLVVDNPRFSFAEVLREFFVEKISFGKIHPSAVIDSSVQFNEQEVIISPNVVIEKNVVLGSSVSIGANTVIKSGTIIHNHVSIGSNCTIGGVGFGYEPNEEGIYELIPHLGNVILNEKVEIGNNVCIDRAVLGSTILEKEVKIDNLVHIAHGVQIGANSLVIAHAMIAGSVRIGQNTWIAPCASILQKVKVGNNVLVGMGSVVLKDVEDGAVVAGVPAKKMNK